MRALFLRGLTREIRHWNGLPKTFQEKTGIEVLTCDLPGAGKNNREISPRNIDQYVEFLRSKIAHGEPIILIGISMGGMIALRWASLYPNEVHSIFTINTSAKNLSTKRERFNLIEWRNLLKILLTKNIETKERLILDLTTNKLSRDDKVKIANYFVNVRKENPISVMSSLNQLMAAQTFEVFAPVRSPVVVISSLGDRLVNPKCSEKIASLLEAKSEIHPDAGHDLPLDDPQWILSVLMKHI